jgi:ketosteroid isomerase-like protein
VLIEKQAILELVHAYSRAVDRCDFDLLASLYTEDGIDDHTGLYCGPVAGFVDWLRDALAGVDGTTHHVHSVTIALDGTHAEGEVYLTAYNRLRSEDGTLSDFVQGLRYLDHYRRDAGRWRFARRTVVCDWARQGPSVWDASHPLIAGKRIGRGGADDPSYSVLRSRIFARHDADRCSESVQRREEVR